MKTTGIVRPVDALGRVVIPVELRRNLDIKTDDQLEVYVDGQFIILKKHEESCVFCGSKENNEDVHGKSVCNECLDKLKQL